MSSLDETRGRRSVPNAAYVARLRVDLFMAVRTSKTYRRLVEAFREERIGLWDIVKQLNLVQDGHPVSWALSLLRFDMLDRRSLDGMDPVDRLRIVSPPQDLAGIDGEIESVGWVLVSVSATSMVAEAYLTEHWYDSPLANEAMSGEGYLSNDALAYGDDAWDWLEAEAVERTRAMVAATRAAYEAKTRTFYAGRGPELALQIERLAFRLTKQAGRNPPYTDRRLCRALGIDVPAWP